MTDIMINALNSKITSGELEGSTVRDYFEKLLTTLWTEGEIFSGKRPFGNSGWEHDLIYSLVECAYIPGKITRDDDDEFYVVKYNDKIAYKKVMDLIKFMCKI